MTHEEFAENYQELSLPDMITLTMAMKKLVETTHLFVALSHTNPGARRFSIPWGLLSLAGILTHGVENKSSMYRDMLKDTEKFLYEIKDKYQSALLQEIGEESK